MSDSVPTLFPLLDRLVSTEGFSFQAWDDRYCKGVWAALGPIENSVDELRDFSSAGDLEMIPAMDYAFSAEWLPWDCAPTLTEAMAKLEAKLASLPTDQLSRSSVWSRAVLLALDGLSYREREPIPASYAEFVADRS